MPMYRWQAAKARCCRCTLAPNPKDLASAMHPCHHARNKHKCLRPSHQWFRLCLEIFAFDVQFNGSCIMRQKGDDFPVLWSLLRALGLDSRVFLLSFCLFRLYKKQHVTGCLSHLNAPSLHSNSLPLVFHDFCRAALSGKVPLISPSVTWLNETFLSLQSCHRQLYWRRPLGFQKKLPAPLRVKDERTKNLLDSASPLISLMSCWVSFLHMSMGLWSHLCSVMRASYSTFWTNQRIHCMLLLPHRRFFQPHQKSLSTSVSIWQLVTFRTSLPCLLCHLFGCKAWRCFQCSQFNRLFATWFTAFVFVRLRV